MKNRENKHLKYYRIGLNHGRLDQLCTQANKEPHFKISAIYKSSIDYHDGYNQGLLYEAYKQN